jgi:hypothetical protein
MKTVRMSTILKAHGNPVLWVDSVDHLNVSQSNIFSSAIKENRVITVNHGDSDRDAWYAEVGKNGCNVVGFAVFEKPLPSDILIIIGVERHMNTLIKNSI